MKIEQSQIDLGDTRSCTKNFVQYEYIITDRGSKYSVSGGKINGQKDVKDFLKKLKSDRNYLQATHNTYAARVSKEGQIWETRSDDGETGAGNVILRILQKENITNTVVVVTRWYGGVKLMNDRYKHVQDATKYFVDRI